MKKKRKRERAIYDDQTLENLRDYYKIESHDVLLKYIKKRGLALHHSDDEMARQEVLQT
jgi:predicted alpha/beta-fold hydrolase